MEIMMIKAKSFVAGLLMAGAAMAVQAKDIVDTAVSAGNFKTLAAALQAAGLIETLKGPGPFTVFAPTDAAFAKIPKAQLDALLKDKAALTKVRRCKAVSSVYPPALESRWITPT